MVYFSLWLLGTQVSDAKRSRNESRRNYIRESIMRALCKKSSKILLLIKFIMGFMRPRGLYALLFLSLASWPFEQLFIPYFIKLIINGLVQFSEHSVQESLFQVLFPILVFGVVGYLALEVIFRIGDFLMARLIPNLKIRLRLHFLSHVASQSKQYFSLNLTGNLSNKINDFPRAAGELVDLVAGVLFPVILSGLLSIGALYSMSFLLGSVFLFCYILHLGISVAAALKIADYSQTQSHAVSKISGYLTDFIINISSIKAFSALHREKNLFMKRQEDTKNKEERTLFYTARFKILIGILTFCEYILVVYLILKGWQTGLLNLGDVAFIFGVVQQAINSSWYLSYQLPHIFEKVGTLSQSYELLSHAPQIQDKEGAKSLRVSRGSISIQNLCFGHDALQRQVGPLFTDLSLDIKGGEKVGLVGFSGSGKTTLVNLLLRSYEPLGGTILIDSQDIQTVTQDSLRNAIALIPQDISLFHRTLYENVIFGKPEASQDEVLAALEQAQCMDFIKGLPQGLETEVGERGLSLSGGQRQRIAIARAILKNAPILILDEATSALDSITELKIQKSLMQAMENRTSIVIAHRLSTLQAMDRLIVFDKGQIIEQGTHEALLKKGGAYEILWKHQSEGFIAQ